VRERFNARWEETNMVASLFCAREEFTDDVVVVYGDIVFEPRVVRALLAASADVAVVVDAGWRALWDLRMADPLGDAETLKLNAAGEITEVGKKPGSYDDIQGQYIGLFKVARAAWPRVAAFYDGLDRAAVYDGQPFDKMYMTSFIDLIAKRLLPVRAVRIEHGWLEVDTPADLSRYEALGPDEGLFTFERTVHAP
jgi:choline kinase